MFLKSLSGIWLTVIILLAADTAESAVSLKNLNLLQGVSSVIQDRNLILNIRFKEPVRGFKGPVFYPRSIQMEFNDAYVEPSRRYFPLESTLISEVNVFQFDRKTVRIRMVLAEEGLQLNNRFHITRDAQGLKIKIDLDGVDILDRFLREIVEPVNEKAPEPESKIQEPSSVQATQDFMDSELGSDKNNSSLEDFDYFLEKRVVKSEEIQPSKLDTVTPVSMPVKSGAQNQSPFLKMEEGTGSDPPGLTESALKMFSMLTLLLGIMFVVLYLFKKYVFKNGLFGNNDQLVNVLGSGMLAHRKSITFVEVAGDVFILGVSQDHIALLATIQDEAKIDEIKKTISMKPSIPAWFRSAEKKQTTASTYRAPSKAEETFEKYVKRFSSDASKPSVAEFNSMIQKKLSALRTA